MKSTQKFFRAGLIAAVLAIACITVGLAASTGNGLGVQINGSSGGNGKTYSPVAPNLLVQCLDTEDHGNEEVELDKFMHHQLSGYLPTETTSSGLKYTDASFEGYAKAYKEFLERGYSEYQPLKGLDYAELFRNLEWVEDKGVNQFFLQIKPDGVNTLVGYYNENHDKHSLLRTSQGEKATHNCTEDSSSLEYYSCVGYTPATCTQDGSQAAWCNDCGKIYKNVTIPATEHKPVEKVFAEATCTTAGLKLSYCANPWCDEADKVGSVSMPKVTVTPASGHRFEFKAESASGVDIFHYHFGPGLQQYVAPCNNCGLLEVRTVQDSDKYGINVCRICASGSSEGAGPSWGFDQADAEALMKDPTKWIGGVIPSDAPSIAKNVALDEEPSEEENFAPIPDAEGEENPEQKPEENPEQ